jgi:hypothetical protein
MKETITIPIQSAFDTITARVKVREFARKQGLDVTGQARISLAAYSLANASELLGKTPGRLTIHRLEMDERIGVRVACVISDLDSSQLVSEALENIKWLVDEFDVDTLSEKDVQVAVTQWAPPPKGIS